MYTTIIELEGTDKVGKSTMHSYLGKLGHYKYLINDRGILTQLVYRDKFKRNVEYKLTYIPLIVLLEVDEDDFKVRCSINNEPTINFVKDKLAFNAYACYLESLGIPVLRFNTSKQTPYSIAKEILNYTENDKGLTLADPITLDNLNLYTAEDLVDEDIFYE